MNTIFSVVNPEMTLLLVKAAYITELNVIDTCHLPFPFSKNMFLHTILRTRLNTIKSSDVRSPDADEVQVGAAQRRWSLHVVQGVLAAPFISLCIFVTSLTGN